MEVGVCPASDSQVGRVVEAIESYLSAHPGAADSELGIAEWWLPTEGVDADPRDVAAALDWLVAHARVERQTLPDGRVIFRVAREASQGDH